ncbi:MAG: RNA-directed DNA polymerase, partial [Candidatus Falkowbacteria bacterium]|nr:RNA-directed DNA polymerase [Candidatus Falkowbacteria bacterium]
MSDQLLTDLFSAYYDARRHKRNTLNALEFEINYEHNLLELYHELKSDTYKIGSSVAFVVFDPVQREIIASPFRDRVIHHLVFNYINPILEKVFINDSYSCRQGRGTSYGINRVTHFVSSCSNNYHDNCFILKLDLAGYFMSINHKILYEKVKSYLIKHNEKINFDLDLVLVLLWKIIFHFYTTNCIIRGGLKDWQGLPRNKSLFYTQPGFGLPIGNLTSQLFSNIYLNDFDHYIKRELKFKYYGRYVDDLLLVHQSRERLKIAINEIRDYLQSNLNLKLHPKKIYL